MQNSDAKIFIEISGMTENLILKTFIYNLFIFLLKMYKLNLTFRTLKSENEILPRNVLIEDLKVSRELETRGSVLPPLADKSDFGI